MKRSHQYVWRIPPSFRQSDRTKLNGGRFQCGLASMYFPAADGSVAASDYGKLPAPRLCPGGGDRSVLAVTIHFNGESMLRRPYLKDAVGIIRPAITRAAFCRAALAAMCSER